ncbi:hypothetical protein D621_19185 [beta proteobacterium AAP51]|nr:hypothetical protein D621_19185 [beta proteobacterium AAP51]
MKLNPQTRSWLGLLCIVMAVLAVQGWWKERRSVSTGAEVAELARESPIRMMSSDVCAVCDQARHWMTEHQVPFTECSIERDPKCRADFEASRSPGTPVMLVGEDRAIVGFSPERLRATLARPQPSP